MRTAILWYRRDLRVHDHPALTAAAREYERVLPVFVLDDALLHGRYRSAPRTEFMLGCLHALDEELHARGSRLATRHGRPEQVLTELTAEAGAEAVLWTSDVSPYARARDRRVTEALRAAGVEARPHGGNYVIDVSRPRTGSGNPYGVFSPFHRAWHKAERRPVLRVPRELPPFPGGVAAGKLPRRAADLGVSDGELVPEPAVEPGEAAAREAARRWLAGGLEHYHERQNGMTRRHTAQISPYVRWGCLSPRELEDRANRRGGAGAGAWTRQLCWRDFYAHILLHHPENVGREHQERLRGLSYDEPNELFDAWRAGRTGFPAVDAGMRQLAATGWMHNRARLIVGSFVTKDLHIDWRAAEIHFARLLLDGEPAQNNGNWQWIASVGTDPAPAYRRTYNPALQGRRFDPEGEYVRCWVPELGNVPVERLFEPWTMTDEEQEAAGCVIGRDYPDPIVDHRAERERALERYRQAAAV